MPERADSERVRGPCCMTPVRRRSNSTVLWPCVSHSALSVPSGSAFFFPAHSLGPGVSSHRIRSLYIVSQKITAGTRDFNDDSCTTCRELIHSKSIRAYLRINLLRKITFFIFSPSRGRRFPDSQPNLWPAKKKKNKKPIETQVDSFTNAIQLQYEKYLTPWKPVEVDKKSCDHALTALMQSSPPSSIFATFSGDNECQQSHQHS